jgi:hypothetical protein
MSRDVAVTDGRVEREEDREKGVSVRAASATAKDLKN